MKHNICGYEWNVTPDCFLGNHGCPKCATEKVHKKQRKTTKQFVQEVYELVGGEYTVLGEYINNQTKISIKHNICNYEYLVTPGHFLRGRRCTECRKVILSNKFAKKHENFIDDAYNLYGNKYTILETYINAKTKILVRNNECGHEWKIQPTHLLNDRDCPICFKSKGEQIIANYLINNKINYQPEYTFDDLLSQLGFPLRFDFGILGDNDNLIYLIEYDGIQHYEWMKGWITKENFDKAQYHDQLKNKYCQNNNILLLRIPYWEFDNIETILNNHFNEIQ
jgi:hypothetical protein